MRGGVSPRGMRVGWFVVRWGVARLVWNGDGCSSGGAGKGLMSGLWAVEWFLEWLALAWLGSRAVVVGTALGVGWFALLGDLSCVEDGGDLDECWSQSE